MGVHAAVATCPAATPRRQGPIGEPCSRETTCRQPRGSLGSHSRGRSADRANRSSAVAGGRAGAVAFLGPRVDPALRPPPREPFRTAAGRSASSQRDCAAAPAQRLRDRACQRQPRQSDRCSSTQLTERQVEYRYSVSSLVERSSCQSHATWIWLLKRESNRGAEFGERCRARRIFLCRGRTRYRSPMAASVDFTISFDSPDEEGWIVARVLEVPGAMSQGRTREEARENALDALRTVLTPDEELAGQAPKSDREHLRFTAAA